MDRYIAAHQSYCTALCNVYAVVPPWLHFSSNLIHRTFQKIQYAFPIVSVTLVFIVNQHVFSSCDCYFALQRPEATYRQARSKFREREVFLFKIAFNNPCSIKWIPAIRPVFCHANMRVLKTGTRKVNKTGQLFTFKEEVAGVVITTGEHERRLDAFHNRQQPLNRLP